MTSIQRTITLRDSDPAKQLRFRLERHVVEYVVDGHDGGFGPFLRNLIVNALRRLKDSRLVAKSLLKFRNPSRVAASPLLDEFEVHAGGDELERLSDSRDQFRRNLKNNFGHLQSSLKAGIEALSSFVRESEPDRERVA